MELDKYSCGLIRWISEAVEKVSHIFSPDIKYASIKGSRTIIEGILSPLCGIGYYFINGFGGELFYRSGLSWSMVISQIQVFLIKKYLKEEKIPR